MPAEVDDPRLSEALDQLYRLPPDRSIETRDALVREQRQSDRREAAQRLQRQRKPTLAAWAVNQLVHRQRDQVDELLRVGDRIRGSADEPETLRSELARLREVTDELKDAAAEALAELGTDPAAHLDDVERTLPTGAVVPDEQERFARGHLVKPLAAAGSTALAGVPLPGEKGDQQRAADRRERRRLRELRADQRRLRRHVEPLQRELGQAQQQRCRRSSVNSSERRSSTRPDVHASTTRAASRLSSTTGSRIYRTAEGAS